VPESSDDRAAALARAMNLAASVTSIALQMIVPALVGLWLDQKLGVPPLCAAAGAAVGLYVGIRSLMLLTRPKRNNNDRPGPDRDPQD
jgi:F0F1-type ATP synthase assembly protein I